MPYPLFFLRNAIDLLFNIPYAFCQSALISFFTHFSLAAIHLEQAQNYVSYATNLSHSN